MIDSFGISFITTIVLVGVTIRVINGNSEDDGTFPQTHHP